MRTGRGYEETAGIGNHRRAAIRHQSDACASLHSIKEDRRLFFEVLGPIACQGCFNAMMREKQPSSRGVF